MNIFLSGKDINFITGSTLHDAAGFILGNPIAFPPLLDRINVAETNDSLWANLRRSVLLMTSPAHLLLDGQSSDDVTWPINFC